MRSTLALLSALAPLSACVTPTTPSPSLRPWTPGTALTREVASREAAASRGALDLTREGREIVVAGALVPVGTPVVLWRDPGGYNAYAGVAERASFEAGRPLGARRTRDPEGVRDAVDQLVLHYDVAGTSRECFRALEARGLSCHFLIDLDGTIYQTLDLADTAWHARQANGRSIGVELANIGAYPSGSAELRSWYGADSRGTRITIPRTHGDGGLRTPGFVPRPARPERVVGRVNGRTLEQYDYTPEQYEALARLTAALVRSFPRLDLRFPTDPEGRLVTDELSDAAFRRFRGVLGHQHITSEKTDPGPAFDWVRFRALTIRALELL